MAKPLLNLHGQHEPFCEYPTTLKVAMDDGTVQTYVLENRTTYQFGNVMKCLNRIKVGYQYNYPMRKRNRLHSATVKPICQGDVVHMHYSGRKGKIK